MNILVTGANGFVGQILCGQLKVRGLTVRAAVRCCRSSQDLNEFDQVVVGNIGPETDWQKALAGVDCVVHLAARVHVMADSVADPLTEFSRVNRDGTIRLAEQAVRSGVRRFVYLSSIKVNGEETFDCPFSEVDQPNPLDPYGVSKAETEVQLLALASRGDMEIVIIRPPLVYGPSVKANFYRLMQILEKGVPLPFGAIYNKRSLVGLDNLVDFIIKCIEHPRAANQTFLVSDGEDLSTTDLLKCLSFALGKSAHLIPVPSWFLTIGFKMMGKCDFEQRLCGSLQVDIRKAQELLEWIPSVSVNEGLKKTADWYKSQF